MSEEMDFQGAYCPIPLPHGEHIVLGHGSGGKMSQDLIANLFQAIFNNPILNRGDDAAVIPISDKEKLVISTDSHVVDPLFFPGGDIGRLAICGTVNDVAVMGATPKYISVGFILEEGLETATLGRIVTSMQQAADEAQVRIVTGDTKVVPKGKADGLYINTCGIGTVPAEINITGCMAQPGDIVILSGTMGDHGIAVVSARGDLGLESNIRSDVAPLNGMISQMMQAGEIHTMRDPTRGGVGTTLNEIARQSKVAIWIEESRLPVKPEVAMACELLGFDPLYIANEGKVIAIVKRQDADAILNVMREHPYGKDAQIIGEVKESPQNRVLMRTAIGSTRIIETLSGELLPRIC